MKAKFTVLVAASLSTFATPVRVKSWPIVPDWTFHDLRRTATTGMARLDVAPHVADAILNHKDGTISGVAAIYNQYDYLKDSQLALKKWEKHVLKQISAA
jgi:integrase